MLRPASRPAFGCSAEEGALDGVIGAHGVHVWATAPSGLITSRVRCTAAVSSWLLYLPDIRARQPSACLPLHLLDALRLYPKCSVAIWHLLRGLCMLIMIEPPPLINRDHL